MIHTTINTTFFQIIKDYALAKNHDIKDSYSSSLNTGYYFYKNKVLKNEK